MSKIVGLFWPLNAVVFSLIFLDNFAYRAQAGIVPIYQSTEPDSAGSRWSYGALVGERERIEQGDFFVIYDFVGFSGFHVEPIDWLFTAAYSGPTQGFHLPDDDPNILNLAWSYMGTGPIVGPSSLGLFAADSEMESFGSDSFLGRATGNGGSLEGKSVFAGGVITVPKAARPVPEPNLIGVGIVLTLAAVSRQSTRRSVS